MASFTVRSGAVAGRIQVSSRVGNASGLRSVLTRFKDIASVSSRKERRNGLEEVGRIIGASVANLSLCVAMSPLYPFFLTFK